MIVKQDVRDYNHGTMMVQGRLSNEDLSRTIAILTRRNGQTDRSTKPSLVRPAITGAPDEQRMKKYPIP